MGGIKIERSLPGEELGMLGEELSMLEEELKLPGNGCGQCFIPK